MPLRAGSSKIPRFLAFLGLFFRVLGFGWYVGPYHWGVGPILGIPFRAFFSPRKIATTTTKIQENSGKNLKFSKNPNVFDKFPVAPGRSLGYPGRPTGKFSIFWGFFEKI